MPTLLLNGGPVIWLILLAAAVALVVFIERVLYCHRSQINSAEFLNGVRNVLKRNNVVEAISICDATPGPVARIVKTAILNRDRGRERVREAVEEAGLTEVPLLEEKSESARHHRPNRAAARLARHHSGFHRHFRANPGERPIRQCRQLLAEGVWEALICAAAGIAVAIPAHAGYNYLVSRINKIVLDMERAAGEIVNIVTENGDAKSP